MAEPKPQRRIVTTHKGTNSAIMIDETLLPNPGPGGAGERVLWQSHEYPANVDEDKDHATPSKGFYAKGSTIRIVDIPPHSTGFNHRTNSLDYGIVMDGSVELALDDGSKTMIHAGDVVVQRATMHQWNNPTDKTTRVVFVLMPATPRHVDGVELEESKLPKLPGQEE
ncbi:Cupin RmlC-type [Macrophomina phaseolina MS6]|uniref:Cupin RmlC-type n=1 Tax=Macrophomina phaseolina (strain MS6) TaxID=1126212 RepID=K2RZJ0_MACPH|nr:Cupin RmlC-type [Macrophomina phaseolina MS6]